MNRLADRGRIDPGGVQKLSRASRRGHPKLLAELAAECCVADAQEATTS